MRKTEKTNLISNYKEIQEGRSIMNKAKPFKISKNAVWEAYIKVRENKGAAGVDKESIEEFGKDLKNNLYKIWNRMSSGSYFPAPVLEVEIPKSGGTRKLGIPTVSDRICQMVAKIYLEPEIEPYFHEDSYGYRFRKSALDGVEKAKARCWKHSWVIDLDIRKFFDSIDRKLLMRALKKHTRHEWIMLYVDRWLKAPIQTKEGKRTIKEKGIAQGSVISPLLANLFLHYAFDDWMKRNYPMTPFERYADDAIIHCNTEAEARILLGKVRERLAECDLDLHPDKTKIVYCKKSYREKRVSKHIV